MKIARAIEDVEHAEADLADELRRLGERHAAEADVYHTAHRLAQRCTTQVERLAPFLEPYGAHGRKVNGETPRLVERARRLGSMLGKHDVSALLLLQDLESIYLSAHRAELAWTVLLQAARAARDSALIEATTAGCEEAERRWKWVRTRVKQTAPQTLVAG
jgi:hypothetical protein